MTRIAMWSGPRNLSTAMMYAFGSRADCAVWDEPFYAAYLAASGSVHPMGDAIIAAGEVDPVRVAARCLGPVPGDKPIFYMKHMPHQMLSGFPLDWARGCVNVHLIRHPARVIASYGAKRDQMSLSDIGYVQQVELFRTLGGIVIDSADIRQDPRGMLARLCARIGIAFDPAMLSWPEGGHPDDGIWAPHWYGAVHRSTGFAGPEGPIPDLTGEAARIAAAALPYYDRLAEASL